MKYKILSSSSILALEDQVSEHLNQGYRPLGRPFRDSHTTDTALCTVVVCAYFQAVVKDEDSKPPCQRPVKSVPSFEQVCEKKGRGKKLTSLEHFIFMHQPTKANCFMADLEAAVKEIQQ